MGSKLRCLGKLRGAFKLEHRFSIPRERCSESPVSWPTVLSSVGAELHTPATQDLYKPPDMAHFLLYFESVILLCGPELERRISQVFNFVRLQLLFGQS